MNDIRSADSYGFGTCTDPECTNAHMVLFDQGQPIASISLYRKDLPVFVAGLCRAAALTPEERAKVRTAIAN